MLTPATRIRLRDRLSQKLHVLFFGVYARMYNDEKVSGGFCVMFAHVLFKPRLLEPPAVAHTNPKVCWKHFEYPNPWASWVVGQTTPSSSLARKVRLCCFAVKRLAPVHRGPLGFYATIDCYQQLKRMFCPAFEAHIVRSKWSCLRRFPLHSSWCKSDGRCVSPNSGGTMRHTIRVDRRRPLGPPLSHRSRKYSQSPRKINANPFTFVMS